MSPGNEQAINRQIIRGKRRKKGRKKKKAVFQCYSFLRCMAEFFKIRITQRDLIGFLLILLQIINS